MEASRLFRLVALGKIEVILDSVETVPQLKQTNKLADIC